MRIIWFRRYCNPTKIWIDLLQALHINSMWNSERKIVSKSLKKVQKSLFKNIKSQHKDNFSVIYLDHLGLSARFCIRIKTYNFLFTEKKSIITISTVGNVSFVIIL